MAQNKSPVRGRPRRYDPDVAIRQATAVFRAKGFAGTTLEELGEAMGMNRPSIHAAFGDKSALFLKALQRYEAEGETALRVALHPQTPLRMALHQLFSAMVERFASEEGGQGGCLLFSTAAEIQSPVLRDVVSGATCSLQDAFTARFSAAMDQGEIAPSPRAQDLALLATSLVHSLSLRARGGETKESMAKVIAVFVGTICGPET